ncbi:MAG: ribosome assembly factor SBDS [Thaumarchaeota archaeon]|nr:ribosome assembly factor SBDS [Nitrososphaerota archaeon]
MTTKISMIRYLYKNNRFEILVNSEAAFNYKYMKKYNQSKIFISDEVYADSKKGIRFPTGKLLSIFGTNNIENIKKIILDKGELNLTTEQRRNMIEQRKKQIIEFISKSFIDPKSNLPHPTIRIEQAINNSKVSINLSQNINEQVKYIIDKIRVLLPLKSSSYIKISIIIPNRYAFKSYPMLKTIGKLIQSSYEKDGSLKAIVEIQAALKTIMIDKLNIMTKNTALVEVINDGK